MIAPSSSRNPRSDKELSDPNPLASKSLSKRETIGMPNPRQRQEFMPFPPSTNATTTSRLSPALRGVIIGIMVAMVVSFCIGVFLSTYYAKRRRRDVAATTTAIEMQPTVSETAGERTQQEGRNTSNRYDGTEVDTELPEYTPAYTKT